MRNEAISIETEKKVAKPKIYVFNLFLFGRIETATRCVRSRTYRFERRDKFGCVRQVPRVYLHEYIDSIVWRRASHLAEPFHNPGSNLRLVSREMYHIHNNVQLFILYVEQASTQSSVQISINYIDIFNTEDSS